MTKNQGGDLEKIKVRWVDTMHTGDDFDLILQALEVGLDEGPLMLVPRRRRPAPQAEASYHAQVFENPDWLRAHFSEHESELNHEFWIGICENLDCQRRDTATAALWHFCRLTDALAGRNKKGRRLAQSIRENKGERELTYGAIPAPPQDSFDAVLENVGDAFDDVALLHKDLPRTILISRG
ncbi:hypothetical protein GS397_23640 [Sphingobium yanoikuyae]|uniref:Uncharacterized protein n=1 Tax=Sphingobium yanoikuyae TaxID=13690 RepID=A0A6P1GPD0_SPHYA|nr:hypothetical protein [Sphingobium yanoikuyae]QHD69732.1 hypothetical protein GS397_23640 [Sphingobium yanoikuyae]